MFNHERRTGEDAGCDPVKVVGEVKKVVPNATDTTDAVGETPLHHYRAEDAIKFSPLEIMGEAPLLHYRGGIPPNPFIRK